MTASVPGSCEAGRAERNVEVMKANGRTEGGRPFAFAVRPAGFVAFGTAMLLATGCAWFSGRPVPARYDADRLVDPAGMTLYVFDRDPPYAARSLCVDACAREWPPFLAGPGARWVGEFALIDRMDGSRQWTWRGRPLYLRITDTRPGDATGHGSGNLWRAAER